MAELTLASCFDNRGRLSVTVNDVTEKVTSVTVTNNTDNVIVISFLASGQAEANRFSLSIPAGTNSIFPLPPGMNFKIRLIEDTPGYGGSVTFVGQSS